MSKKKISSSKGFKKQKMNLPVFGKSSDSLISKGLQLLQYMFSQVAKGVCCVNLVQLCHKPLWFVALICTVSVKAVSI